MDGIDEQESYTFFELLTLLKKTDYYKHAPMVAHNLYTKELKSRWYTCCMPKKFLRGMRKDEAKSVLRAISR